MKCPRDKSKLVSTTVEDLRLDSCPTCRGIWFDAGELAEARDRIDPDVAWLDFDLLRHPESYALHPGSDPCPRCQASMCRVRYGETEVDIDTCPFCHGVWLDEAQLSDIIVALESEAGERSMADLLRESLRDAVDMLRHPSHAAQDWRDLREVLKLVHHRLFSENANTLEMLVRAVKGSPLT